MTPEDNASVLPVGEEIFPEPDTIATVGEELTFPETQAPVVGEELDVFAPENLDLFKEWRDSQPEVPILDRVSEVAGHVASGFWETSKLVANDAVGLFRAAAGGPVERSEYVTKILAQSAETGSEAFKGYAITGEFLKKLNTGDRARQLVNRGTITQEEADRIKLAADQTFHRSLRDLTQTTNDGRVIMDNVLNTSMKLIDSEWQGQNVLAQTEVNEEAAQFLANLVDPDVAAVAFRVGARSLGRSLIEQELTRVPAAGTIAATQRDLVAATARSAASEAEEIAIRSAGGEVPKELAEQVAKDQSEVAELNSYLKQQIEKLDNQRAAQDAVLEKQFGKGYLQRGTGQAVELTGRGFEKIGNAIGKVNEKVDNVLSHFAAGDEAGEKLVDSAAGRVIPGNNARYALEGFFKKVGRDVSVAGKYISAPESSLGYFKSLSRALPEDSVGRWAASQAERVEFLATTGRWVMDTTEDSLKASAVGGAFGALSGDPVAGATQGLMFGMAGSQLGQFRAMNSPEQVYLQQKTDIAIARKRRDGAPGDQLTNFNSVPEGMQLAIATFEQAHPDLNIRLVREGGKQGSGWYSFNGRVGEVTLDLDHPTPMMGLLTHEVKHHIGRNPIVAQAVETKILGDSASGQPGIFTALDENGKPVVLETSREDGSTVREFALTPEFYSLREEYLQQLRDAGLPTLEYERNNKLIAHELWAEAEAGNLLSRQANGKFDSVAAQAMGPVQRKVADYVAGSRLVNNSAFIQKSLAKFGIMFDGFSGQAARVGHFSKTLELAGMREVVDKYYRSRDAEKAVGEDADMRDARYFTEDEILKNPDLSELFSSGFDTVRDPVTGKMRFVSDAEARKRSREFVDTLTSELSRYTGNEPGVIKQVEVVDSNGRRSQIWSGTFVPESVIAKMEASGRFNPNQLQNLRILSKLLTEGRGSEVNFFYQPASKRGGKIYRTRPITERTETPMSIKITKDGNVVVNTISQEKLQRNAVEAVKAGKASLWGNDYQALWKDIWTYLDNHAQGVAGDANGLGADKRDFINSLFGQFTKEQRAVNPLLQEVSERRARNSGIVQSRRLDRTNRLVVLSSTFKPDYNKVSRNFSPAAKKLPNLRKDLTRAEKSEALDSIKWALKRRGQESEAAKLKSFDQAVRAFPDDVVELNKEGSGPDIQESVDFDSWSAQQPKDEKAMGDGRGVGDRARLQAGAKAAGDVQLVGDRLPAAVKKKTLDLVHYSTRLQGEVVEPGYIGKGRANPRDLRGANGSFWFVKGTNMQGDGGLLAHKGTPVYGAKVSGARIYDSNAGADKLNYWGQADKWTAEEMLIDAGYAGWTVKTDDGREVVKLFEPVSVEDLGQADGKQTAGGVIKQRSPGVLKPKFTDSDVQFSPGAGNPETRRVAEEYARKAGIEFTPHKGYDALPEDRVRAIADYFDAEAKHEPDSPEVAASYKSLIEQTKAQYQAMLDAGVKIEPWLETKGEPYANSTDMMKDVQENNHLWFFLTDNGFGDGGTAQHPMLEPTGIKIGDRELLANDLFRAVHDYFGHTQQGFQFGPRGEFNAWKEHSRMFTDEAQGALAAETLAQNAWVNFGPHLRDASGKIAGKGEDGYVPPQERPFADQKAFVLPPELRQFSPGVKQTETPEFKKWFGDSKVVDENGEPLVVYRGTQAPFTEMTTGAAESLKKWAQEQGMTKTFGREIAFAERLGDVVWFTDDPSVAEGYADGSDTPLAEVYLALKNPLDLRIKKIGVDRFNKLMTEIRGEAGFTRIDDSEKYGGAELQAARAVVWDNSLPVSWARNHGYDGLIHDDTDITGRFTHTSWVAFSPEQIKSATGNAGTFDPTNPDIRFSPGKSKSIVVGSIEPDGEIQVKSSRYGDFGHDEAFPRGWDTDTAWRFRSDTGVLYWWNGKPGARISDAVVAELESRGYTVKRQTTLLTGDQENAPRKYAEAHGEGVFPVRKVQEQSDEDFFRQFPEGTIYRNGKAITAKDIRFSPGTREVEDSGWRISTRLPTAVKAAEDPVAQQLVITAKEVTRDPAKLAVIGRLLRKYPMLPDKGSSKAMVEELHRTSVENLLWLHDQMAPELRDRAKKWYDGARKLTEAWAEEHGHPRHAIAGVLASLSPQKDWYMNVDLGRRVIEHTKVLKDREVTDGVVDWVKMKFGSDTKKVAAINDALGKTWDQIDLVQRAMFLRAYDEMNHARSYQIISPEGDFVGPAMTKKGEKAKVAWGDFGSIAKAISILTDPTKKNVSDRLGGEHKVRNFYNNILLPNNADYGDVTIDTHAVAAALLSPLAGSDLPVVQNLGGGRAPGSSITGTSGLYGIYADAYREAAGKRDILPREMQSITWEAVRGLFSPEFKTKANKAVVDSIWRLHKAGTLTLDEARTQIAALAGGIDTPSWAVSAP